MSDRFLTTSKLRRRIDQYEIEPDPPEPDEAEPEGWLVQCSQCGFQIPASDSVGGEWGQHYCPECYQHMEQA